MKYGTWNISQFDTEALTRLTEAGYSPLAARVLCSRGYTKPQEATAFLSASGKRGFDAQSLKPEFLVSFKASNENFSRFPGKMNFSFVGFEVQ
ncbi:MAG: hypothetical protein IKZ19_03410 [Clostridia bacterium]|nr:hypothetical protein [Clostridia bacterium]